MLTLIMLMLMLILIFVTNWSVCFIHFYASLGLCNILALTLAFLGAFQTKILISFFTIF